MNDYLGNLIGKSFGQARVVQPRRTTLFAPSPYLVGALAQAADTTPQVDASLLPSRRMWVAEEEQPDSPASEAQDQMGHGQQFSVSTDATSEFDTADSASTSQSARTVAPSSAGRSVAQLDQPEMSAPDLSLNPHVHTRRRRSESGQMQSQPQRENTDLGNTEDDSKPSVASKKSEPSVDQRQQAAREAANQSLTQDPSASSVDGARAAAPNLMSGQDSPPSQAAASLRPVHQEQIAAARSETPVLDRPIASVASAPQPENVDRRLHPIEDPTGRALPESFHAQRPSPVASTVADGVANESRLATIRTVVPVASAPVQDRATGDPRQQTSSQASESQQAVSNGHATEQTSVVIRPALRSLQQGAFGEPRPVAAPTSTRAGFGLDGPPEPVQQTIHVTIGRIEVRATPAPSTPAPARKQVATQVMSLDDYLKARSGGQR